MHRYLIVDDYPLLHEKLSIILGTVESEEDLSGYLYDDPDSSYLKKVDDHGWNTYHELVEITGKPSVFLDIWKAYQ